MKTWVGSKGFKDPAAIAESAYNLEKLIGFDKAGRTLVVPKDDAAPEEVSAFHQRLGVPLTPNDYKLPVPEGVDPAFSKTAATWMHKRNIPAKAAEGIVADYNAYAAEQQRVAQEKFVADSTTAVKALQTEWGAAFEANREQAMRAAKQFLPAKNPEELGTMLNAIERAVGTSTMLKFFQSVGAGLGEHKMVGSGDSGGQAGAMTPAQAQARISALKADKEWTAKYIAGDAEKRAEMDRLHKWAYPE